MSRAGGQRDAAPRYPLPKGLAALAVGSAVRPSGMAPAAELLL